MEKKQIPGSTLLNDKNKTDHTKSCLAHASEVILHLTGYRMEKYKEGCTHAPLQVEILDTKNKFSMTPSANTFLNYLSVNSREHLEDMIRPYLGKDCQFVLEHVKILNSEMVDSTNVEVTLLVLDPVISPTRIFFPLYQFKRLAARIKKDNEDSCYLSRNDPALHLMGKALETAYAGFCLSGSRSNPPHIKKDDNGGEITIEYKPLPRDARKVMAIFNLLDSGNVLTMTEDNRSPSLSSPRRHTNHKKHVGVSTKTFFNYLGIESREHLNGILRSLSCHQNPYIHTLTLEENIVKCVWTISDLETAIQTSHFTLSDFRSIAVSFSADK